MRRLTQTAILVLFFGGSHYGWKVLQGNLSGSRLFEKIPLADPFAILQMAAAGTIAAPEALWGALIVLIFFGLIGGRAFCSWICPMNIVTETAAWLRRQLPDHVVQSFGISRKIRYWAAGIAILLSALLGVAAFEWLSPVSMLHRGLLFGMGAGWMAVAAIFFFDLFLKQNGFCGHLCPLGAFYSLISRFSLIRVRHRLERCTHCMRCLERCPERQVLPMIGTVGSAVLNGECSNCGRCIDVCADRAMVWGMRR